MPFPSQNYRQTLETALNRAQQQAGSIKGIAQNNRAAMAAGPVTYEALIALLDNLKGAKAVLSASAALPGIAEHAEAQLGTAGQNLVANFTAMMDAIDDCGGWIITNFPRASDGALKMQTMNAQGDRSPLSASTTQTAPLRPLLDALIATID